MPVRPRRVYRSGAEWTPRVHLALTIGPCPLTGPSDEVLRAAWDAYRAYLLSGGVDPETVWGFRAYEGGGAERPTLRPVDPEANRSTA